MNTVDFIFQLLHIPNLPSSIVLTSPRTPCTPFVNYAHLSNACVNPFADYENTFDDNIKNCVNYGKKSDNCASTLDD
jgi:hypothetical protein